MTCWNDCSVQEGYSKQTLMTLINGVNEVLTGRVSFCRQCSTGIMANVSGDNYIYYTLSYGILAGVWGARQLERRVKALALFKTEMCTRVFVCVCTTVFTPIKSSHPGDEDNSKTTAPNSGWTRCLHKEASNIRTTRCVFKHLVWAITVWCSESLCLWGWWLSLRVLKDKNKVNKINKREINSFLWQNKCSAHRESV